MSTLTYWSFLFLYIFVRFFLCGANWSYVRLSLLSHNLNSSGHCIGVHQGKISAAAGLEPGTHVCWVIIITTKFFWKTVIIIDLNFSFLVFQFSLQNDHGPTHPLPNFFNPLTPEISERFAGNRQLLF